MERDDGTWSRVTAGGGVGLAGGGGGMFLFGGGGGSAPPVGVDGSWVAGGGAEAATF